MGCQHTDFRKGQSVFVIMKSGKKFSDKYIEKKSGVVILKSKGRVNLSDVRQILIKR